MKTKKRYLTKIKLTIFVLLTIIMIATNAYTNAEITLSITTDSDKEIKMTSLDLMLFNLIMEDINDYDLLMATTMNPIHVDRPKNIELDGGNYFYNRIGYNVSIFNREGELINNFELTSILSALVDIDVHRSKCPACVIAGGILLSQGICALSAGGEHAYCNATCQCGVQSVSTTCVLGFRSTSCVCMPCPQPPIPLGIYPSGPGWNGPFFSGTPWDSNGNIVFDLP